MDELPIIDGDLTPEERKEKRAAYIADQTRHAELAEQGKVGNAADIIYSGLQEAGIYSEDPKIDSDPEVIRRFVARGKLPIKERSVSPSGDWELTLSDAGLQMIQDGKCCANCENFQPDTDEAWDDLMRTRAEYLLGPRPEGATRHTNCCYCGYKLGIHGTKEPELPTAENFTPDQMELFNQMFLGGQV